MAHPPELKKLARTLRGDGLLIEEIATQIGVPKSTVIRWCNPGLEARERKRARKQKFAWGRKCPKCKKRRVSNYGEQCERCYHESKRVWTREKLIAAVQEWAVKHGRPPTTYDWVKSDGDKHPAISFARRATRQVFATGVRSRCRRI